MPKHDLFTQTEVQPNAQISFPAGQVRAMCTDPNAAWFFQAEGFESLAHVGAALDVTVSQPVIVTCQTTHKSARVFVRQPFATSQEVVQEVYTNMDRQPHESGQVLEVRRAMREFQLQQRQAMVEIRKAQAELKRVSAPPAETKVKAEPEQEAPDA